MIAIRVHHFYRDRLNLKGAEIYSYENVERKTEKIKRAVDLKRTTIDDSTKMRSPHASSQMMHVTPFAKRKKKNRMTYSFNIMYNEPTKR